MREVGLKACNRGASEKEEKEEEKHNTTMIVVADHLSFRSSLCNSGRRRLRNAGFTTSGQPHHSERGPRLVLIFPVNLF